MEHVPFKRVSASFVRPDLKYHWDSESSSSSKADCSCEDSEAFLCYTGQSISLAPGIAVDIVTRLISAHASRRICKLVDADCLHDITLRCLHSREFETGRSMTQTLKLSYTL